MKPCRVCQKPVVPWKGPRAPYTTIHRRCLYQPCRFCGVTFKVKKERRGIFCCTEHEASFRHYRWRSAEELGRAV
jgi:hypothetical protein